MQSTSSADGSVKLSDARFLNQLSIALTIAVAALGVLAVVGFLARSTGFDARDLPGVKSEADVAILEGLNVAAPIFTLMMWLFLLAAVLQFWRRRPWSRWVAAVFISIGMIFGIAWGVVLLFGAVTAPTGEWTSTFNVLFRVVAVALGSGALGLAYFCSRVVKRLMSRSIAQIFSHKPIGHGV